MNAGGPAATDAETAGVLAPAPVFFGAAIAAGYLLEWLRPTLLQSFPYATALGLFLIAVSVVLVLCAVVPMSRARTAFDARKPTTTLVTTGAFRISRNPTYLSLLLLQVGLAFASHSAWLLITAAAAAAITHWGIILREERYLERKFGDEYRRYATSVRRWL
jgi:protein-S-isoprenylcysteine O-methyltransferase Ste14